MACTRSASGPGPAVSALVRSANASEPLDAWKDGPRPSATENGELERVLGPTRLAALDAFDRVQLEEVVDVR